MTMTVQFCGWKLETNIVIKNRCTDGCEMSLLFNHESFQSVQFPSREVPHQLSEVSWKFRLNKRVKLNQYLPKVASHFIFKPFRRFHATLSILDRCY